MSLAQRPLTELIARLSEIWRRNRAILLPVAGFTAMVAVLPFLDGAAWSWRGGFWTAALLLALGGAAVVGLQELVRWLTATRDVASASMKALRKETALLRDRLEAGERQIALLRYPNSPRCVVFFGHHKCASRFFRFSVFSRIADSIGARVRRYEIKDRPFHYSQMDALDLSNMDLSRLGGDGREVILFANASQRSLDAIRAETDSWKAVRVLRDPRQVLVSNYFHHRGNHRTVSPAGWIWDTLVHDKPILRDLPEEDGLLYELDHISKEVIETQILAPFDDRRVLALKLEDLAQDPVAFLQRMAEFLEVPDIAGVDLSNTRANQESRPWQKALTPRLREIFKERYGQALIDTGYARDLDW